MLPAFIIIPIGLWEHSSDILEENTAVCSSIFACRLLSHPNVKNDKKMMDKMWLRLLMGQRIFRVGGEDIGV